MFLRCCFFIRGAGGGERVGPLVSEGEDLVISGARGEGAGLQLPIFADELYHDIIADQQQNCAYNLDIRGI